MCNLPKLAEQKAKTMKNTLTVQLKNIPNKGWEYHFDRQSKDLNQILEDLIGDNNYSIDIHILPTGESTYKIKGVIQAQLNLLCSRCAYEFKYKIHKPFLENIIIQQKQQRIEKEIRINHYSEQSQQENFTVLNNSLFKLADFIYEMIAIEEPLRPLGSPQCDQNDNCKNLKNIKNTNIFYKDTTLEEKLKIFLKNQSSTEDSN